MRHDARRRIGVGLVAALAGLCLTTPAVAAISVTDFTGQTIRLDRPARRIVALAPHLVENLYSAGAGNDIVGAVQFSDYPPAAKRIPRIGGYDSMSLEAIVALHPDLVVAWGSGGTADLVKRLKSLGIPVYIDVPQHFADIDKAITDFGTLSGHRSIAHEATARFDRRIAKLRKRYSHEPAVSLFYVVSNPPLQTLSDRGLIGDVFTLCAAHNIFADAPALAPRVSIESVLAYNPEAIVAGDDHAGDWKAYWRQWPALQAVNRHRLISVAADVISRPSTRIATGAADLCAELAVARH